MVGMYILGKKTLIGVYINWQKKQEEQCSTRGLHFTRALYHGIHSFWILTIYRWHEHEENDGQVGSRIYAVLISNLCIYSMCKDRR